MTKPPIQTQLLLELAERCEKAMRPDRELDCAIGVAIGQFEVIELRGEPAWVCRGADGVLNMPGQANDMLVPAYTASIDAAMTLVPDVWHWRLYSNSLNRGPEAQTQMGRMIIITRAATPALALCAAALRSRSGGEG